MGKNLLYILFAIYMSCSVPTPAHHKKASPDFASRPNILWLVAEDLSPVIPPFGDSTITTPALSRLAAEGVRYTHVFSPSGVCAPSRAALAMGMYPAHIGAQHMRTGFWASGRPTVAQMEAQRVAFPPGLPYYEAMPPTTARMHSEYLRQGGYYCSNRFKQDYQFVAPVTAWDDCSPTAHWRGRAPGQPFFSIFNFEVTHESQIWAKAKDSLWIDSTIQMPIPPYLPTTPIAMQDVRRMYSNIKIMDDQVGKILHDLEADGLLANTIVFWFADHGGPLPRQKRLCYDSGLRAPLIIRYPDQWRAGTIDSQLISFVDFLPTLISMAGLSPTSQTDGRNFNGKNQSLQKRKYIHAGSDRMDEKYDMIRAVRDQRYKYLKNFETTKSYYLPVRYREQMPIMQELLRLHTQGLLNPIQAQWFRSTKAKEELFDTYTDPYELNNLASFAKYQTTLIELRNECDRWMADIEDKGRIEEKIYVKSIWNGDHQPITKEPEVIQQANRVTIHSPTEGASIGYKIISGAIEPKAWAIYQGPIDLPNDYKLKIIAHRIGFLPSRILEYKFN